MYSIMNLATCKIVASGFSGREIGKPERNKLNEKKGENIYIMIRSTDNPRGASKISDINFKSWKEKGNENKN